MSALSIAQSALDDAWGKQYDEEQAAKEQEKNAPPAEPNPFEMVGGRATPALLDQAIAAAERLAVPGVAVWDLASAAVHEFRDRAAQTDPTYADPQVQFVAHVAILVAVYAAGLSHVLERHGKLTPATDDNARLADLHALGQATERHFVTALVGIMGRDAGVNAFINYIAHQGDHGEAFDVLKSDLDTAAADSGVLRVLRAAAIALKLGNRTTRHYMGNGVTSLDDVQAEARSHTMPDGGVVHGHRLVQREDGTYESPDES